MPEIDEGRFASIFRSDLHVHNALALFALFGHKTNWSHVPKDNDSGHDVARTFGMGKLRDGCSCSMVVSTDSELSRGQFHGRGAWFGDSLRPDPLTPWPNASNASACFVPLYSLLLGFEIVVRSFHTVSAQKFCAQRRNEQEALYKPCKRHDCVSTYTIS